MFRAKILISYLDAIRSVKVSWKKVNSLLSESASF